MSNSAIRFIVAIAGYGMVGYATGSDWRMWLLGLGGALLIDTSHWMLRN